jgi:ribonuclease E
MDVAESVAAAEPVTAAEPVAAVEEEPEGAGEETGEAAPGGDDDPPNRRRGRRGGRRRRREGDGDLSPFAVPGADQPELQPVYAGPTPADPFGGRAFDIFDVMDQAERAAEAQPMQRIQPATEIADSALPEPEEANTEPVAAAVELADSVREPIPPAPDLAEPEPEIVNSGAPEPVGETLRANPEPAAPTPANDTGGEIALPEPPPPEPLIKPILIGAEGEAPVERKRGWWRR